MIVFFSSHKHVIPKQGWGGSPPWKKFPYFPVFFFRERPLLASSEALVVIDVFYTPSSYFFRSGAQKPIYITREPLLNVIQSMYRTEPGNTFAWITGEEITVSQAALILGQWIVLQLAETPQQEVCRLLEKSPKGKNGNIDTNAMFGLKADQHSTYLE